MDRIPPHNIDAEESCCGAFLIDGECIRKVINELREIDFYSERNRWVYQSCVALYNRHEKIDQITVAQELARTEKLENIGGAAYLSHLISVCPTSLDVEYYANIVQRLSISRGIILLSNKISDIGFEALPDPNDTITKTQELFDDFKKFNTTLGNSVITPMKAANDIWSLWMRHREPSNVPSWGFKDLDNITAGIFPEYVILAARTSIGKCLGKGTKICNAETGELKNIEDFIIGDKCLSINNEMKIQKTSPIKVYENGIKECFEVETASGRKIETTINHPFLTSNGWIELEKIKIDEMIATPRIIPIFGDASIDVKKARLIGYFLAEGGITKDIRFTTSDTEILKDFKNCIINCFSEYEVIKSSKSKKYDYRIIKKSRKFKQNGSQKNDVQIWLESIGLYGELSKNKVIPNIVFTLKEEELKEVLRAIFSCDGTKDRLHYLSICLASKEFVYQLQHLLLRFGILSQVHYKRSSCNGKKFDAWRLTVTNRESRNIFWNKIGFIGQKSKEQFQLSYGKTQSQDFIPNGWNIVKNECKVKGKSLSELERLRLGRPKNNKGFNTGCSHENLTRQRAIQYANVLNSELLKKWAMNDIFWDKITSIKSIGFKQTYDLTIEPEHNYVANDIIVHNTQLALDIAESLVQQGKQVLFASAEMTDTQIYERKLARLIGLSILDIRKYGFSDEHEPKIVQLVGEVSESKINYLCGKLFLNDVYKQIYNILSKQSLDCVFLDYIGALQDCYVDGRDNQNVKISKISNQIQSMVHEFKVPIVALSQLNREIEHRADPHPQLSDLRDSGSLEQDADVIFLGHRDKETDGNYSNILQLAMAKNRQIGAKPAINLIYNEELHRYVDFTERSLQ